MYTIFGQEAKDGDFVLVQNVRLGDADIYVAQVKGNKAYAANVSRGADAQDRAVWKWIRKQSAVVVIPASAVLEQDKQLIQMNMDSVKASFKLGTDYCKQVIQLISDANNLKTEERVAKYGEDYRYR